MRKNILAITIFLALTGCITTLEKKPEPAVTSTAQAAIPNPASVFCEQNGNKLEIFTADDGSQSGVCIFQDGSTCDEWAYFRGECGPSAQNNPTPSIKDEATTEASGGGIGENASGGYMAPGTTEAFSDWWGLIKSTESGAQFDDYFERQDLGGVIYFGIDSEDSEITAQIGTLRDTGKIVHLYGTLVSNVPDYNGSQVLVDRIVVEE